MSKRTPGWIRGLRVGYGLAVPWLWACGSSDGSPVDPSAADASFRDAALGQDAGARRNTDGGRPGRRAEAGVPTEDASVPANRDAGDVHEGIGGTVIGPAGGSIALPSGAVLTIPPGALDRIVRFAFSERGGGLPAGYRGYSSVFQLEPPWEFRLPVQLALPFSGDHTLATLFAGPDGSVVWSGGRVESTRLVGSTTTVGVAFVADGVHVDEVPDLSCIRARVSKVTTDLSRRWSVLVGAEDCAGRVIPDLQAAGLGVTRDGVTDTGATPFERDVAAAFVGIVLDAGQLGAEAGAQTRPALRALIGELYAGGAAPHVGLFLATGGPDPQVLEPFTLDPDALLSRIDGLAERAGSASSSVLNLNGAVVAAALQVADATAGFGVRNGGGAVGTGYVIAITTRPDTAGYRGTAEVAAATAELDVRVSAVGIAEPAASTALQEELQSLSRDGPS